LLGTGVRVCTVVGFPLGYNSSSVKENETVMAIKEGAQEIDMVMNVGAFLSGDYETVAKEISEISRLCKRERATLKVIIECCYLTRAGKARAAFIAEANGADFVKTSTGFGPRGASASDVRLLRKLLKKKTGVKAAGGVNSLDAALILLEAGADRLGTSSAGRIMEEFDDWARLTSRSGRNRPSVRPTRYRL
jgi:deoxyribose-phosphate aldolase